jgi:hypothetical protein
MKHLHSFNSIHKTVKSEYWLRVKSACPSAHVEKLSSHWSDVHEIRFFENFPRKFKFDWNLAKIMGTLHEDICTFMVIFCWILVRMKTLSDKSCTENQNTHFMFKEFFQESCCLWDHVGKYCTAGQATDDNIIWHKRIACWITKVIIHTYTHKFLFCHGNNGYTNVPQCYIDTYIACHVHYKQYSKLRYGDWEPT